jgi:hypothetical protein
MKKLLWIIGLMVAAQSVPAQILNPVKWSYAAKKIGKKDAVLFIKATLDEGWHIYSITQAPGGPAKTSFRFMPSKQYTLTSKIAEPTPVTTFDKSFDINVKYFEKSVKFQQKIRLRSSKCTVSGKVKFMVCNDHQCLPPDETAFKIPID